MHRYSEEMRHPSATVLEETRKTIVGNVDPCESFTSVQTVHAHTHTDTLLHRDRSWDCLGKEPQEQRITWIKKLGVASIMCAHARWKIGRIRRLIMPAVEGLLGRRLRSLS